MAVLTLRPRLQAALELAGTHDTVADIGCDHGKLALAFLQNNRAQRVIAADISKSSVDKAQELALMHGFQARMDVRLGDGLKVLKQKEADAVVIAGMGGTLMARLLESCETPLQGAKHAVFQPMRAYADIRRYLFERGYPILGERVVLDAGRLYQVFCVGAPDGTRQTLPQGWPEDCFDVGYAALDEPLLPMLVKKMLAQHEKRLLTAKGTPGAALLEKRAQDMRTVLALLKEKKNATD